MIDNQAMNRIKATKNMKDQGLREEIMIDLTKRDNIVIKNIKEATEKTDNIP
jgi:hypothetical protein